MKHCRMKFGKYIFRPNFPTRVQNKKSQYLDFKVYSSDPRKHFQEYEYLHLFNTSQLSRYIQTLQSNWITEAGGEKLIIHFLQMKKQRLRKVSLLARRKWWQKATVLKISIQSVQIVNWSFNSLTKNLLQTYIYIFMDSKNVTLGGNFWLYIRLNGTIISQWSNAWAPPQSN